MPERDRIAAVEALLRASGPLATLLLGLGAAAAAGAGAAWARATPGAALLLGLAALLLLAGGGLGLAGLARVARLGFCGVWHAHLAARLLLLEALALCLAAALVAAGLALT